MSDRPADQQSPESLFAFVEYDIPQHLGLDRNKASGADPDGALVPDEIFNLIPDRRGSLIPFGRWASKAALTLPANLIGFDTRGLSSFYGADGKLATFDGNAVSTSAASYAQFADLTHLSGTGPYGNHAQFYARTNEDVNPYPFEPFTITPRFDPQAAGDSEAGGSLLASEPIVPLGGGDPIGANSDVLGMAYHDYGGAVGERWAMVTRQGHIKSGPSFNEAGDEIITVSGNNRVNAIAVNDAGVMVAVGNGGVIWRMSGGGGFTPGASASGHELRDVTYDPVSGAWIAVGNDIQRSTDGGFTWAVVKSVVDPAGLNLYGVAADPAGNFVALSKFPAYQLPGMIGWTSPDGVNWTQRANMIGNNEPPEDIAYGKGIWVAVTQRGSVFNSVDGLAWLKVATLGAGTWLDAVIFDGEAFYASGDAGKVHKSSDGTAWEAVPIEGLVGNVYAIVSHSNGSVYVAGQAATGGFFRSVFGVEAGTYTVYWAVNVPTKAGLLVTDLRSQEFVLAGEAGNTIGVTLPSVADIKTANGSPAWLTDAFLTNKVYVDVYVKARLGETGDGATREGDDVLADYGAHFDFTLRPGGGPAGADKQSDTIDKLPIGRLLGDEGAALVVAFAAGDTVMHRERVWGVFSDNEGAYLKSDEDVSIEASQVVSGTAIGYTDIGYANLARPGNYLPIAPGDSNKFVGMVSTPSGLLVFFDNEVHLISGDPNDGSLQTELYPDVIGADVGTKPTRLGGIAFSIWKGNIYALAGGQAQKLSSPAYLPDDKFVEVVPEPASRSLVARTSQGNIFRYVLDFQFWCNNVVREATYLLPHSDAEGVRYVTDTDGADYAARDGQPDAPWLTYRDIDLGDKGRVDAVYGVRLSALAYPRDPLAPPRLYYRISDSDSDVADGASSDYVTGFQYEDEFVFKIPRGKRARLFDLRLLMNEMDYGATIEPHVKILFVPGSRKSARRPPVVPV